MDLAKLAKLLPKCPYPTGMVPMNPIHCGVLGSGFYPGAKGYIGNSPVDGIMLLGRDFGTKSYFEAICTPKCRDEYAVTWLQTRDNILPIFRGLPVWCTNYYVGLRADGSAVGNVDERLSEFEREKYEIFCWEFLHAQVLTQRPRIILVMGDDNQMVLNAENRFGPALTRGQSFTFTWEGATHEARLREGDHPMSFLNQTVLARGTERLKQLKQDFFTGR